ncbi:MAG: hypothetical protein ACYTBX_04840 [Planctomycetota bacterium]|jgi:hypothetical protein
MRYKIPAFAVMAFRLIIDMLDIVRKTPCGGYSILAKAFTLTRENLL